MIVHYKVGLQSSFFLKTYSEKLGFNGTEIEWTILFHNKKTSGIHQPEVLS
jgi:hypothetical protein